MSKRRNIFWGVVFLLCALAVLGGRIGIFHGFSLWRVLLSIGLFASFIEGLRAKNWGQLLFSLAFLCAINREILHIGASWGGLIGAAVLGTIGLQFLFPRRHSSRDEWVTNENDGSYVHKRSNAESFNGERVRCDVCFGSTVKYIDCGQMKRADLECSFGRLCTYFDNVILKDGEAFLRVDVSFGSMEVYLPATWKVMVDVENAFGRTRESGVCDFNGENVLTLKGEVAFGSLVIHYI